VNLKNKYNMKYLETINFEDNKMFTESNINKKQKICDDLEIRKNDEINKFKELYQKTLNENEKFKKEKQF